MSSESTLSLRSFVSLVRGTTYKGELVGQPGPVLLGLASIQPDGGFRRGSFKTYGGESPAKITLGPGDVYVSLKDVTQSGDLLGSVARVPRDIAAGRLTQDTVKLQFDGRPISQRYVYWLLRTPAYRAYCRSHATGTTTLGLARDDFLDFPAPAPSNADLSLVDLLEALDDRITLLRETNATLEAIAQALFKSWFVDFDPVRAKSQGLAPAGMDEATAALFSERFEVSALGPIPAGWRVLPFTDAATVIGGGTPKTSSPEYWDGQIPWFSVVDAPSGADTFVVSTEKTLTPIGLANCSAKLLPVGTTIISARGTVGRLALVGREMAMNQSCYALRGKAGDAYFTYFSTRGLVSTLKQRTHGSVFDTITRDTLAGVLIVYPPELVISAFEAVVDSLMSRIRENLLQSRTLSALRDTLLPRLISGQLGLPETIADVDETA